MAFKLYIKKVNERFFLATLFSFASYLIVVALLGGDGSYGIVIFLLATFLLAIYWISGRASLRYQKYSKNANMPYIKKLMEYSGTTYLGLMMLGTLMWGTIFVSLNAGLGVVGL
jgi:hypothetical protein